MIETLPAAWYRDPDQYRRERHAIFRRQWLLAAHEQQLPAPQGALAVTIAGWPLVLVRHPDGQVMGFHNVCRHRAAPLVWDGQAAPCAQLRCRYHGWRYALDGRLIATPGFGEDVNPEGWGLHPVQVQRWRGCVFVNLDPAPQDTLAQALEGLVDATAPLPLEEMVVYDTARHTLACDWKTYVENYLEGYHIPWLHPRLTQETEMRSYRVDVIGRTALHRVPTREGALSQGLWAWLWPNVALNFYGQGMSIEQMNPLGPGKMEIRYTYLSLPGAADQERAAAMAMSQEVTAEDVQICEAVQQNLEAGVYDTGQLSPRHENGVAAFQRWLSTALAAEQAE